MSNQAATMPTRQAMELADSRDKVSERTRIWRRFVRYRPGLVGLAVIGLLVIFAVFSPLIAPHPPDEIDTSLRGASPSAEYPLGNDDVGRDILSRLLYGARISFQVGAIAVGLAGVLGIMLGLVAGYVGGWVDNVLTLIMDVIFAFPAILLAIAIISLLGNDLTNAMIAIGIFGWPSLTRLVRSEILSLRERQFVEAAQRVWGVWDLA